MILCRISQWHMTNVTSYYSTQIDLTSEEKYVCVTAKPE